MNTLFINDRLSQLPRAMFGKFADVTIHGISLPIFNKTIVDRIEK